MISAGRLGTFLLAALVAVLLFADMGAMAASPKKKPASPKKKFPAPKKAPRPVRPIILAGPSIRYIDTTSAGVWTGTIQIASQATKPAPVLSYTFGATTKKATGVQTTLYKLKGRIYYFWRCPVEIPTGAEALTVTYSFTGVWSTARLSSKLFRFVVAAKAAPLKMAFYNGGNDGTSAAYRAHYPSGGNTTWAQMLEDHAEEPINLLLGVGNVVDNNGVFQLPLVRAIWGKASNRLSAWKHAAWTPAHKKAVLDYYFEQYIATYGSNGFLNRALAQIPQTIIYDEKEVFNGFLAHADLELQFADAYTGIAEVALYFHRIFHLHDSPLKPTKETFIEPGYSSLKYAGPAARVLLLDGREERTPVQIISDDTFDAIFARLKALPAKVDYVYIATAQNPVTWKWAASNLNDASQFPELVPAFAIKSPFGDSALATEIASNWASTGNNKAREFFLGNLTTISNTNLLRFIFLTGGSGFFSASTLTSTNASLPASHNPLLLPSYAVGPIAAAPGASKVPCTLANKLADSTYTLSTGNVFSSVPLFQDLSRSGTVPLYDLCGSNGLYLQPVRGYGTVSFDDDEMSTVITLWWEGPVDKEFNFFDDRIAPLQAKP